MSRVTSISSPHSRIRSKRHSSVLEGDSTSKASSLQAFAEFVVRGYFVTTKTRPSIKPRTESCVWELPRISLKRNTHTHSLNVTSGAQFKCGIEAVLSVDSDLRLGENSAAFFAVCIGGKFSTTMFAAQSTSGIQMRRSDHPFTTL